MGLLNFLFRIKEVKEIPHEQSVNINPKIERFIIQERTKRILEDERRAKWDQDWSATDRYKQSHIMPKLRTARASDYVAWLQGFLASGGELTHYYDYNLPSDFYVAQEDIELIPLYGAASLSIIFPRGVKYLGGGLGHCNLYFMEDFGQLGGWIPVYNNTKF